MRATMGMTAAEVAEELHISQWQVYELIKQRKLPAFHIGRAVRVSRESLAEWLRTKVAQEGYGQPESFVKEQASESA